MRFASILTSAVAFCLLLSVIVGGGTAKARPMHGSSNCPMVATFIDDGCSGAPADGIVRFPAFFTASAAGYQNGANAGIARLSGQTYAARSPNNVSGVDYGAGPSASQVAAAGGYRDPVAAASPGGALYAQGCTWDSGGTRGGPRLRCGGTGDLDFEVYDTSGAISAGGWNCIPVIIENTYTGTVTVKNNKVINGDNCVWNAVSGLGYAGIAFNGYIPSDMLLCLGTQTQGSGGTIVGNSIGAIDYSNITETPALISAAGGGSCAAGFTPYTIPHNVSCPSTCSSSHTVTIGIETATLVITTSSGTIQTGFIVQGYDGAGANVSSCSPTCGGPGTYSVFLNAPTYSPQEGYTLGLEQAPITSWSNAKATNVVFAQNFFDGLATGPGPLSISCALCVATGQNATLSHNAVFRCQCRPLNAGFANGSTNLTFVEEGNYVEEWGMNFADGHLEVTSDGFPTNANVLLQKITGNAVNTTPDTVAAHGTAMLWLGPGSGGNVTIQQTIVAYNTGITNPSSNPVGGNSNVVNTLIERQNATYLSVSVHDNSIDGSGMAGCVGYDGGGSNAPGAGTVAPVLSNNINLITGHVQTGYGLSAVCN